MKGARRHKTILRRQLKDIVAADRPAPKHARPRTRVDCKNVPRPCPFVGCRHNLYLDTTDVGSITLNFPERQPWEMPPSESCSLDVAAGGESTAHEVGRMMNVTRQRVDSALQDIERKLRRLPLLRQHWKESST